MGRATVNINSHVHRNIVRGSIMVEVREIVNWAHSNDYLPNGVDDGQRHDRPVLKEVKRIQVNCTRTVHFPHQRKKASASNFQKLSHNCPCFSNWDNNWIPLWKSACWRIRPPAGSCWANLWLEEPGEKEDPFSLWTMWKTQCITIKMWTRIFEQWECMIMYLVTTLGQEWSIG